MEVTETKSETLMREFKIVVPADDIETRITARLKELAQTVRIDGFRPGKVPAVVMRKRYGPSIMGEVLENTVAESSQRAMEDRGLRPATRPNIEITSFEDGTDLEFTMTVDIMPEIEHIDLASIELERMVAEADEATIDNAMQNLAESRKGSEPITEDRAAESGDTIAIDFVGTVDGEEFPGGKAEGYLLELGSGSFIPGFEDQLVGVKAGEHRQVEITFPDEYGAADLAGKAAVFEVDVRDLRRAVVPPVDDELAKQIGLDDLDALRTAVREEHEREYKTLARLRLKRQLLDKLTETHDFEVPRSMVETEAHNIWHEFEEQRKKGLDDEQTDDKKSDDEMKEEFHGIAERRVRLGLLLGEIGRINNLQVGQEDIKRILANEVQRHPGQEQAVLEYYQNTPEAMQALTAPAFEEKVVDFILEMAAVTDRSVAPEELIKEPEEEAESKPKKKAEKKRKTPAKRKKAAKKKKD